MKAYWRKDTEEKLQHVIDYLFNQHYKDVDKAEAKDIADLVNEKQFEAAVRRFESNFDTKLITACKNAYRQKKHRQKAKEISQLSLSSVDTDLLQAELTERGYVSKEITLAMKEQKADRSANSLSNDSLVDELEKRLKSDNKPNLSDEISEIFRREICIDNPKSLTTKQLQLELKERGYVSMPKQGSSDADDYVSAEIVNEIAEFKISNDYIRELIDIYTESKLFVDGIKCINFLLSVISIFANDIVNAKPTIEQTTLAHKYYSLAISSAKDGSTREFYMALDEHVFSDDLTVKQCADDNNSLMIFDDKSCIAQNFDTNLISVFNSVGDIKPI